MLKWGLDTNGPLAPALCLVTLYLPLLLCFRHVAKTLQPAHCLSDSESVESCMLGICLSYFWGFLQFITCWGVSKSCSYTYWMGEIVASTLRGTFRGRIITDTTKWRQKKVLPMFFVTWKPNKAVRFISEYFEVLKKIDRCCFSVVPAKPC